MAPGGSATPGSKSVEGARVRAGWPVVAAAVSAVVTLAMMLFWASPAQAIVCGPSMNVATSVDLDDAIACYNAAPPGSGQYTIFLTTDIGYSAGGVVTEINQAHSGTRLRINGTGHTVAGPGNFSGQNLFTVTAQARVVFDDIVIDGSGAVGIVVDGDAENVRIVNSVVSDSATGSVLVRSGTATITDSAIIDSGTDGIGVTGGVLTVSNTGVWDAQDDAVVVEGGSFSMSNSMIHEPGDDGLLVSGGSVSFSNSTMREVGGASVSVSAGSVSVSNATLASDSGIVVTAGAVSVVSSVVFRGCSGPLAGSANNFVIVSPLTAPCGPGSSPMNGGLTSAPVGCAVPTPLGCVLTYSPSVNSSAIDGGLCDNVTVAVDAAGNAVSGTLLTDQRGAGFDRTIGTDCDAGAFEVESCEAMTTSPAVESRQQLDRAIGCYNDQTPAGSYTITLAADIAYGLDEVVTQITQNNPFVSLTIDGAGYTVAGPGGIDFGLDFFEVSGAGTVIFESIVIDEAAGAAIAARGGSAVVQVNASTISSSGWAGVLSSGSSEVSIVNSIISESGLSGIFADVTSQTSVSNSTITGSGQAGVSTSSNGAQVTLSNSTIFGLDQTGVEADGGTVSVSNSTIADSNGVNLGNGGVAHVVSSLVIGGCDSAVTGSDSFTVTGGGCGSGSMALTGTLGPLQDNGCTVPTPTGCPPTMALAGDSNAVDSGDCTAVDLGVGTVGDLLTDQRGEPRDPSLCDAGSFEFEDSIDPTITLTVPADGAVVALNEVVLADYSCGDEPSGSGLASCIGDANTGTAIDTASLGPQSFTVIATDNAGNTEVLTHAYFVAADAFCNGLLVTINMNVNGGVGLGTAGADVILGTSAGDEINGAGGDDTICGGSGADTIRGGSGADTIFGQGGVDEILGGGGGDTIDGGTQGDIISGQGGPDEIAGGGGHDTIDGQGAADVIDGGGGNDTIAGQNGADVMGGGAGADTIRGNTGPDILSGEGGDDALIGGQGNDTLFGGPGTDTCAGNLGPNDMAQASTCETTPGVETLF